MSDRLVTPEREGRRERLLERSEGIASVVIGRRWMQTWEEWMLRNGKLRELFCFLCEVGDEMTI